MHFFPSSPASRSRLFALAAVGAGAFASVGCGGAGPASHGGRVQTAAERVAILQRLMSREHPPATVRKLTLLDGLASGELESRVALRPNCKKSDDGDSVCVLTSELGRDEDGTASGVVCTVSTDYGAFGVFVKKLLGEQHLDETPVLHTTAIGEGFSVMFGANTTHEDDANIYFGTAKIAALYARGYMAVCMDQQAGGRKTFDRVVTRFFRSLKFKSNPARPTVFAAAHTMRAGDRTTGFRFQTIARRGSDGDGFLELGAHFHLETDGKTWSVHDGVSAIERDARGDIEKMKDLVWIDGNGPAVLSAKPSEDRRYRLKLDMGAKSSGVESTPKAPLNTELWGAPELSKVSSGAAASYRYAFLDVNDSDPSFHYVTLTRHEAGVLYEESEAMSQSDKRDDQLASKDELHVDARGLVTKEVSKHSVSELVHTWGALPLGAVAGAAAATSVSEKKNGSRTSAVR